MDPLNDILTSLVDSAFPITRVESSSESRLPLPHLLNPIVYGQKEAEVSHDE